MRIVLSGTLSYCLGVRKTIELVDRLLTERPDRAFYMLGEIVHNERVIANLRRRGLRIAASPAEVPADGIVILRSHGTPRALYGELAARGLEYVDATCPMVGRIHRLARGIEAGGRRLVVIGRAGHEEVRGIIGQVGRAVVVGRPEEVVPELVRGIDRAGVVVQSTFIEAEALRILDRIRALVPDTVYHDTICQPTKDRQREAAVHSGRADCVLVIGSQGSANTRHLYEIARRLAPCTYLIDDPASVEGIDIPAGATVFVASGASTPMEQVEEVIRRLEARDGGITHEQG